VTVLNESHDAAATEAPRIEPPSRRERRLFGLIASVFAVLAIAYGLIIPLGFGPDEPRHFQYLPLMVDHHRLPLVLPDGRELEGAIVLHPPLYYVLITPAYVALRDTVGLWWTQRLLRLLSPLFGIGVLWLVWRSARHLFPRRPMVALLPPALMAVWPHFVMDHSVVNNDNGANLAGAALVFFLITRAGGAWSVRSSIIGGLLLGVGALMKGQLLLCLPPVLLLILAWDHGRDFWRQATFWRNAAVTVAGLALTAGWWYARNFMLYGSLNYVAPGYQGIPEHLSFIDAVSTGIVGELVIATFMGLFVSIWAQVGWFPAVTEAPIYLTLGALTALALAGWIALWSRNRPVVDTKSPRRVRDFLAMLLPFAAIYVLIHLVVMFVHQGPHQGGRYAMFALPGFVTFLVAGWAWIVPERLGRIGAGAVLALFVALNALSMWNLLVHLNPTHAAAFSFWTTMPGT
jgi:hypothetical protein